MFHLYKRIVGLSGAHQKNLLLSYLFAFLEAVFANTPIMMILFVTFKLISGTLDMDTAALVFVILVTGVTLRGIFNYLVYKHDQGIGYYIFTRERIRIGDQIKRFPMGYFSDNNIGRLISVLTDDLCFIEDKGMIAMGRLTASLLGLLVSFIMVFLFDWRIGLVFSGVLLVLSPVFFLFIRQVGSAMPLIKTVQDDLAGTVIEYIKGMSVVKAFNLVDGRHKKTAADFKRLRDIQFKFENRIILPFSIILMISGVGTTLIIFASGALGITNALALPYVVMFSIFALGIFAPVNLMAYLVPQLEITNSGLNRFDAVNNIRPIDETRHDIDLDRYDICFENVSFSYGAKQVLDNLSFTAGQKTMTALVGRSGSGKTTIANLVARFWDTNSGRVTIGGTDIKEMSIDSLYKNISMVFQNVYLFEDTVYNNIVFGNPRAERAQVMEACRKARCYDFIQKLPEGFDTLIGEGGATLSGGEKQRISIARAILKDAPIVLLDEATASIDPDNEAYIQEAINALVRDKTLVVIAHKLSSIKQADKILVIDEGRIIEQGTHEHLLEKGGDYHALWQRRIKSRSWKIQR